jgi:branched-chain amino acid transport system substrate-binding protein
MKMRISGVLLITLLVLGTSHAVAQEKLRMGLIYTLSGPAAVIGQQARDGFLLAVNELGRRMASLDVEVIVVDDELKPDVAIQKVKGLIERDKVDFVVGPIFANVLQAIHNPVLDSGTFLIGTNSGPSIYAGNACDRNFFVTS